MSILKNLQIKYKNKPFTQSIYKYLSTEQMNILKKAMLQYGFRLFIKSLWNNLNNGIDQHQKKKKLTEYLNFEKEKQYFELLHTWDIDYSLRQICVNEKMKYDIFFSFILGEYLFEKFTIPYMVDVRIENLTYGGDLDLVSFYKNKLLGIEIKTSPPINIHLKEISAFIERSFILSDWNHVFLMDSTLRLEDKIIPMLEESLFYRNGSSSFIHHPVMRIQNQLFHIPPNIYVSNTAPALSSKIKIILSAISYN
ncbi:MAG: hypothetical protein D6834_02245 [Aquificota bacterium]|nr:MAG: hypothetical protein D6834_02245 [Aquificota bacterium]